MQDVENYRELLRRITEASRPQRKPLVRFRETPRTAILGTLSASIAVVALIIVIGNPSVALPVLIRKP